MRLTNKELNEITGGGISAALLNAIARITNTIYDIGRGLGSSVRRLITKTLC